MAKLLANENVPLQVIEALRSGGHDLTWVSELILGADDRTVLARSLAEGRVLLTFDKDFGELAFRFGKKSSCGVILLRPKLRSPEHLVRFVVKVLSLTIDWEYHFSVAQEGQVRVVALP